MSYLVEGENTVAENRYVCLKAADYMHGFYKKWPASRPAARIY